MRIPSVLSGNSKHVDLVWSKCLLNFYVDVPRIRTYQNSPKILWEMATLRSGETVGREECGDIPLPRPSTPVAIPNLFIKDASFIEENPHSSMDNHFFSVFACLPICFALVLFLFPWQGIRRK